MLWMAYIIHSSTGIKSKQNYLAKSDTNSSIIVKIAGDYLRHATFRSIYWRFCRFGEQSTTYRIKSSYFDPSTHSRNADGDRLRPIGRKTPSILSKLRWFILKKYVFWVNQKSVQHRYRVYFDRIMSLKCLTRSTRLLTISFQVDRRVRYF